MTEKEFISLLKGKCEDFRITISSNSILNINPSVCVPEYIEKTSAQWKNFVSDLETYFSAYENHSFKAEAMNLISRPIIDSYWVDDMDAFLHRLENKLFLKETKRTSQEVGKTAIAKLSGRQVFIVHGHDNAAKSEVARTLERLQITPIILHEQASKGMTIIEKIEEYTDVDFAVVLYTPCDRGRAKEEPQSQDKPRARQNVVFEHGYLIRKLGRDHVCALVKGDTETPGDMSGIAYIKMDEGEGWKVLLAKEMKSAGLEVDLNNL